MDYRNYVESLSIDKIKERICWHKTFLNYIARVYEPILRAATKEQHDAVWDNSPDAPEDLIHATAFYACNDDDSIMIGWLEQELDNRLTGKTIYLPDNHSMTEEELTTLWYEEHPDAEPRNAEELLEMCGLVYNDSFAYEEMITVAENVLLAHQHHSEERERWFTMQQEYAENFN